MIKLKRIVLTVILTSSVQLSFSQSFMFGLGGTYGTDIQQFAPNARVYFGLSEHICFGPEFSYFPSVKHEAYDVQLTEFGFVAHYIFEIKEKVGFYPLLGLNYSVETESHNDEIEKITALGTSFGLGFHLTFNKWLPFAEYKFITGSLSQSTVSIGLIYNLHLNKGHTEGDKTH